LTANKIGGQLRQPIVLIVRPAIFDGYIAALDKAGLAQALAKGSELRREPVWRCRSEEPDHRPRRLLRAGYKRPRRC
jgi:hypothetical protein